MPRPSNGSSMTSSTCHGSSQGRCGLTFGRSISQAVIQAAIDAVRPAADPRRYGWSVCWTPAPSGMTGDPGRLQQIVWNLLINAVKFTPKRGRVEVRLQQTNSHVEIIVSDSGQGISQEQLPRLFERFHQTDNASTRSHAGLGLGLALVRHLVELHGGKVAAQSPGEGQGATFTVELPVATAYREQEREARVHPAAPSGSPSALLGRHFVDSGCWSWTMIETALTSCTPSWSVQALKPGDAPRRRRA